MGSTLSTSFRLVAQSAALCKPCWPMHLSFVGIGLVLSLLSAPLYAQSAATADQLFQEGRLLMRQPGRIEEGCGKLAQSQALDPAPGTLLNLGECYEKLNRTATAHATYARALESARAKSRNDWASFAEERMKELEPRLARLRLLGRIPPSARVELDGKPVDATPGATLRVDPGTRHVVVVFGERELAAKNVQALEGRTIDVALDDATPDTKPGVTTATSANGAQEPAPHGRGAATGVWLLGGLGVAIAASGGIFLGAREGQVSSIKSECGSGGVPSQGHTAAYCNDRASGPQLMMTLAVAGFGVGAALLGTAFVIHLTSNKDSKEAAALCSPGIGGGSCFVRF